MLPSIAKLASKHGIAPLKHYGQNFIFDESLCDRIVRHASLASEASVVLEVGPGPAGLTRSILKMSPKILYAIEMDKRCLPLLHEVQSYYDGILHVINADALQVRLADLVSGVAGNDVGDALAGNKVSIVANLPYNVGTKLLTDWLMQLDLVSSMTLMLQKEVVDRIIASVGSKDYGRLSILCQILCDASRCFDVSPQAFYPPPKIWSSVVRLVPKEQGVSLLASGVIRSLERLTACAFSARRKMLRSSLKPVLGERLEEKLTQLGIDLTLRAEDLLPSQYLQLAMSL
jgi:16S rRNA (adenine1518-N6/adenine1519-N6)-dimethyltransferase